jgi:hypothetical protein
MRNRRRTRLLRRLVLGFAVAAIAAPVAQARLDEGGQSQKPVFIPWVTDFGGSVSSPSDVAVRPDDKAVRGVPATTERLPVRADDKVLNLDPTVGAEYNQFTYRRALPEDYGAQPVQIVSKADGFDWSDAGIGAGLAFGLMLLAAGAAVGTRHIGRPASI